MNALYIFLVTILRLLKEVYIKRVCNWCMAHERCKMC